MAYIRRFFLLGTISSFLYFDALTATHYDEQSTEELRLYLINYFSPYNIPQRISEINLLKLIPMLVERGADPNTSTRKDDGFRPIDFAANIGCIKLINFLLEHGADINANSSDSMRALRQAASRGHEEASAFLITIGAKTNTEALRQNLSRYVHLNHNNKGNIKFPDIEYLLKEGADPNIKEEVHNWTALHIAAQLGDIELINCLIVYGADVQTSAKWDLTPLDYAASNGHAEATIRLIALGAKPRENYVERKGKAKEIISRYIATDLTLPHEPALHRAIRLKPKDDEFDRILAEARNSLRINELDIQGQTALSVALIKRDEHAILALLASGADPLLGIYNGVLLARQIKEWQRGADGNSSLYERILSAHLYPCFAMLQALEQHFPREVARLIIGWMLSCRAHGK